VASSGVTWSGLTELQQALQHLPDALVGDARAIVQRHAEAATAATRDGYPSYARHLRGGVSLRELSAAGDRFGIGFQLRNTSPDASWFEFGTQIRRTAKGHDRGAMPAGRVLVPIAIRERAAMLTELVALVRAAGFTVTGA
jgi:hypothetical protein